MTDRETMVAAFTPEARERVEGLVGDLAASAEISAATELGPILERNVSDLTSLLAALDEAEALLRKGAEVVGPFGFVSGAGLFDDCPVTARAFQGGPLDQLTVRHLRAAAAWAGRVKALRDKGLCGMKQERMEGGK